MEDAEEKYTILLTLDDMTVSLRDKALQQFFKKMIYIRRHYCMNNMILV